MSSQPRRSRYAILAVLLAGSMPASASNPEFQAFFFQACAGATGLLAVRCAETQDGLGNVSGDSESSLNPSHGLSHNNAALGAALARSQELRERSAGTRDTGDDSSSPRLTAGPWGEVRPWGLAYAGYG